MRTIKFRGKTIRSHKWVHGYYRAIGNLHFIYTDDEETHYQVLKSSLGQYIGRVDNNGNKIYSGDIVKKNRRTYVVKWDKDYAGYYLQNTLNEDDVNYTNDFLDIINDCIVVSNIYDNQETIKE